MEKRFHCELCGKKMKKPETDSRKLAMCDQCVKDNSLSKMLEGKF